ncbi:hypothetical protein MA16_Dca020126 [Dendrobium catenatum]|uniref:Uncharacterized protein n=1 Tax=Dendrobium catenatum TaxID=906689 RepID=A0A2I0WEQ8_9ASPA|nr:hypothetical protein MA16_Dca020126 [Dendrobium catenatum]
MADSQSSSAPQAASTVTAATDIIIPVSLKFIISNIKHIVNIQLNSNNHAIWKLQFESKLSTMATHRSKSCCGIVLHYLPEYTSLCIDAANYTPNLGHFGKEASTNQSLKSHSTQERVVSHRHESSYGKSIPSSCQIFSGQYCSCGIKGGARRYNFTHFEWSTFIV